MKTSLSPLVNLMNNFIITEKERRVKKKYSEMPAYPSEAFRK